MCKSNIQGERVRGLTEKQRRIIDAYAKEFLIQIIEGMGGKGEKYRNYDIDCYELTGTIIASYRSQGVELKRTKMELRKLRKKWEEAAQITFLGFLSAAKEGGNLK